MTCRGFALRLLVAVSLLSAPMLAGCGPKPRIEASWPRADKERAVPRPELAAAWPLTGKPALDETAAAAPAVLLAVSDEPASASLPGLDAADVVFEIAVGANDRIAALFHSALPSSAGPLRAADASDQGIADAYRAKLAQRQNGPLADVAMLAAAAQPSTSAAAPPRLRFASSLPTAAAGTRVKVIEVPLAGGSKAEWHYDVASGAYQRFVDAQPALAAGGRLIRATNVVVLWVPPGATWPGTQLTGTGRTSVFLDGRKFVGSWEASAGPPVLRDTGGVPIELQSGNTWFEVVSTATNILLQ